MPVDISLEEYFSGTANDDYIFVQLDPDPSKCKIITVQNNDSIGIFSTIPATEKYKYPENTNYISTREKQNFFFSKVLEEARKQMNRFPSILNADVPYLNYLVALSANHENILPEMAINNNAKKIGDGLNILSETLSINTNLQTLQNEIANLLKSNIPNDNSQQNNETQKHQSTAQIVSEWRADKKKFPELQSLLPHETERPPSQLANYWINYKKKFLETYLKLKNEKSRKEIIAIFHSTHNENRQVETMLNWISKFEKKQDEDITYKRGGTHKPIKLTKEVKEFLLVSSFISPSAKPRDLAHAIANDATLNIKTISKSCVKKGQKKLKLSAKKVTNIHFLKNSIGFIAMRICWAKQIKHLIYDLKFIPTFIDESSIKLRFSKGHALIGAHISQQSNLSQIGLSLIIWTIPFIGFIFEVRQYGYTAAAYSKFLVFSNHFINTIIFNSKTKFFMIQDNNGPHKTDFTKEIIGKINLTVINNVEYSPECNGVAENMFKVVKIDELYTLLANCANNAEIRIKTVKDFISSKLQEHLEDNPETSFKHWLYTLDKCEEGYPLDNIEYIPKDEEKYNHIIEELKMQITVEREKVISA